MKMIQWNCNITCITDKTKASLSALLLWKGSLFNHHVIFTVLSCNTVVCCTRSSDPNCQCEIQPLFDLLSACNGEQIVILSAGENQNPRWPWDRAEHSTPLNECKTPSWTAGSLRVASYNVRLTRFPRIPHAVPNFLLSPWTTVLDTIAFSSQSSTRVRHLGLFINLHESGILMVLSFPNALLLVDLKCSSLYILDH